MTFSSLPFLIFLPVVLLCLHLVKQKNAQQIFLLAASYFFYAWWDVRFLLLMIAETAVCWALALWMQRSPAKANAICAGGVTLLLAVLGVFKYYNFFAESLAALFHTEQIAALSLVLPIGISFYTFQGISYLADVKRGTIAAQKSFVRISLYISFFAQLVAGPIVRSSQFLPQLDKPIVITRANLYEGYQIFLFGFLKKRVFADRIGSFVTAVYAVPQAYHTATLWLAVLAYTAQIYFDFSGYSDMAIGAAKMLGFHFERNFNAPFLAKNPSEFWRRWHISLSQWLRDYLYIPLGGSRQGLPATCRNLMITMLLGGLWHGANWNFILWGGLHGAAQCLHKLWRAAVPKRETRLKSALSTLTTAVFAALAFVFFRCEQFSAAAEILKGLFVPQTGIFFPSAAAICGVAAVAVGHLLAAKNGGEAWYPVQKRASFGAIWMISCVTLLALVLSYAGDNPFIYFQF